MAQHQVQKQPPQQRDDLSGEHPLGDAGQLVLACLFISTWVLDTFILKYTTLLNRYIPLIIRIPLGVVFVVVSFYLAAMGLHIVFGERREKPSVITKSVFGITRHPIYLSEILLYLGLLMMSLSLAAAFVCGITILFLHHISRYEERLLLARFGEEYSQYIQKVPMWLPQPWKKRAGTSESIEQNNGH